MSFFFQATNLANQYENYRGRLHHAFETARNATSVSPQWRRIVRKNALDPPSAAVPASALQCAQALSHAIEQRFHVRQPHHQPGLFSFTLILRDWFTPVGSSIDLDTMKRKVRSLLTGHSSLLVIEPAFYANVQGDAEAVNSGISWHTHGLLWDVTSKEAKSLIDGINSSFKHQTLMPNMPPAQCKLIAPGTLPAVVSYMAKPPTNSYRKFCWRHLKEQRDRELGVATVDLHSQRKQAARPGELVTLFHALKDIDPIDLLVGSGEGRRLLRGIRTSVEHDHNSLDQRCSR